MRLAYTAVILFGATHWLKSIGVLLAVYGLMARAVYARARWTARRFLRKQLLSRLHPLLAERLEALPALEVGVAASQKPYRTPLRFANP